MRESRAKYKDLLKSVFGYDAFRPQQEAVIDRVVCGSDALVIMPTGGGKSLCYQLPALIRSGTAIVVSPLISLMQDQIDSLRQYGVAAAALNSSLHPAEQQAVERKMRAGELDLVYVAPERLTTPAFTELMDGIPLALIAIDEAHCISQWGHDFRPEYLQIADVRKRYAEVPCIAVTATADEPTQKDVLDHLAIGGDGLFVTGFDRPNIRMAVEVKRNPRKQLLRFLEGAHAGNAGIVYCLSRKKVEETASWLTDRGWPAIPYHAGLSSAERERNQQRFLREEGLIVVATVAFGMGIDKPNVRFVAHLDVPKNLEGYYQEVGRAGRDGLPADAWMAYGMADVVLQRRFIEGSESENEQHKWALHHKLNAIVGYCETAECRRRVLLNYFGEDYGDACGNCDNCLNPVESFDGTVAAQMVLSCVHRTGQRFGPSHVVDVVTGSQTEKVGRFGHHRLPTFGVGADRDGAEWRSIIRQLVAADLLRVDVTGYGGLKLTPASGPVLKGERSIRLRRDPIPKKSRPAKKSSTVMPGEGKALFEHLRNLRLEMAREQNVPPYVIFHDRTLAAMARQRPSNLSAFKSLPGVGDVKLQRYGPRFLDAVAEFTFSVHDETS